MTQRYRFSLQILSALAMSIFSCTSFAAADCDALKGCDKKVCNVEEKISIAKQFGNKRQENDLTIALENINKYCTVEGLRADLLASIEKSGRKIDDYELDRLVAQKKGKSDKVLKYEQKIQNEKDNITLLKAELRELDEI
jgi:hypothetical protein